MRFQQVKPFHFTGESIANISRHYSAKYMGSWCIRDKNGNWSEQPVEVFYQDTPDISKGHSHYFGVFRNGFDQIMITRADSAFEQPIVGIEEDGIIYVSRYRHDFVKTPKGNIIDGGRDYLKTNVVSPFISITVKDGEFVYEELNK